MSTTDATAQDTEEDPYAQLLAYLSDENAPCKHETYQEVAKQLPFVVDGVTDVSDARDHLDNAFEDDQIAVTDPDNWGRPDLQIHTPDCSTVAMKTVSRDPEPANTDDDPDTSTDTEDVVEPPEEEKDDYTRALEDRVDDLENTVEDLVATVESYEDQLEQVTHGLTELQANKLARGDILSAKGTDVDRLNSLDADGIDLTVKTAGNREIVRAEDTNIGDSGNVVNELPDFDQLIPLEADRQRLRYNLVSDDDITPAKRRRAVHVWQDIHVLNSNDSGNLIIEFDDLRNKVESILDQRNNSQSGDSLSETTRRVRRALVENSGGVLNMDRGTQPHRIIGSVEDVRDARLNDGEVARSEDGDAMVLSGGGSR